MERANLNSLEVEYDDQDPDGYRAGMARFGPSIGAEKLGASLYELPPGQSICPYHYEYPEEEWLIVLEGRPTLRHPEGEEKLEQGDVVCFPEGPEGAHKVTNRTDRTVKVLMFSTKTKTAVAVYPDSDKIGIWTGNDADHVIVPRASNVDYYAGET
jgi:uncharacterized cupin superfamily protein